MALKSSILSQFVLGAVPLVLLGFWQYFQVFAMQYYGCVAWYSAFYETACTYSHIIAYMSTCYYAHIGTYPYIASYSYAFCVAFFTVVVFVVVCSCQYGILPYIYIVA